MSTKKKSDSVLDAKQERVLAKHTFTSEELVDLGRAAGRSQIEVGSLDAQLSSIKSDYKGRIEGAEMRRDSAFDKLRDGFEMREVEGIIVFNRPKKGQKTIYHYDENLPDFIGALIRAEDMTPGDCQAELFAQRQAEEDAKKNLPNPVLEKENKA